MRSAALAAVAALVLALVVPSLCQYDCDNYQPCGSAADCAGTKCETLFLVCDSGSFCTCNGGCSTGYHCRNHVLIRDLCHSDHCVDHSQCPDGFVRRAWGACGACGCSAAPNTRAFPRPARRSTATTRAPMTTARRARTPPSRARRGIASTGTAVAVTVRRAAPPPLKFTHPEIGHAVSRVCACGGDARPTPPLVVVHPVGPVCLCLCPWRVWAP